jgi:hypothetical protein
MELTGFGKNIIHLINYSVKFCSLEFENSVPDAPKNLNGITDVPVGSMQLHGNKKQGSGLKHYI